MSVAVSSSNATLRYGIVGGLRPGNTAHKIIMGGLRLILALGLDPRQATIVLVEGYSAPILYAAVWVARARGWSLEIISKAGLTDDEATACFVRSCNGFAFIGDDLTSKTVEALKAIKKSGKKLVNV